MLRGEGLAIDGVPGEGYRLAPEDDSLTAAGVQALLDTEFVGKELIVSPSLTSTNTVVKEQYIDRPHGFTLLAAEQTGGRGRLGRAFASPRDRDLSDCAAASHPALIANSVCHDCRRDRRRAGDRADRRLCPADQMGQ